MWIERIFKKPHVDEEKIGKAMAKELSMLEEEKKKKAQLSRHYSEIKEHVLKKWLNLSSATTQFIEGSQMVTAPLYLNTWSTINVNDKWHIWMMQHIENGYPEVQRLFEKLRIHEKKHNSLVSSLLTKINDEFDELLAKIPHLDDVKPDYRFTLFVYLFQRPLTQPRNITLQKAGEKPIQEFERAFARIRSNHEKDLQQIENGIREDERLLDEIKGSVDKIIDGLELEKTLKGKCDYERVLE